MKKEGKYFSIQDLVRLNKDEDIDNLGNVHKLEEVYGKSKMQPRKNEVYKAFKSPYIQNPLKNLKEKNLEKVNKFTREKRKNLLDATIPPGDIDMVSSSNSDDHP